MSSLGRSVETKQVTFSGGADQIVTQAVADQVLAVAVKAHAANAAVCHIGPAGVTAGTGYELSAGDSLTLELANAHELYVIGTATQKLSVLYVLP
jgi:hypothetical protein